MQAPHFTQSYNRYAYCLNNPLIYTDPSGDCFWIPAVIIGAYLGGTTTNGGEFNPGKWDYSDLATYGGMIIGGVAGYAGAAVGTAAAASLTGVEAAMTGGMMGGLVGGAINSGGMTALAGGSFTDVLGSIIQGGVIGGFSGLAGGAAFYGAGQYFSQSIFRNTLSYMAGSSASQMAANIMTGQNPFDIDWGLNPGIIVPGLMDVSTLTAPMWADSKFAHKIVNRQITKKLEAAGFENHSDFQFEVERPRFGMLTDGSFGLEVDGWVWATDGSYIYHPEYGQILTGASKMQYALAYDLCNYLFKGMPQLPYQHSMMSNSNYYSLNSYFLTLFSH